MVHDVQFCSEGKSVALVRLVIFLQLQYTLLKPSSISGHDHAAIGYALDAGASIMIPQVDTVEQAKHVCSAAKFRKESEGQPISTTSEISSRNHRPSFRSFSQPAYKSQPTSCNYHSDRIS